jgi:hypothetical protein
MKSHPCNTYAPDLIQIRTLAEKEEDENLRFRQFLKFHCDLEIKDLDQQVFDTTKRVWLVLTAPPVRTVAAK